MGENKARGAAKNKKCKRSQYRGHHQFEAFISAYRFSAPDHHKRFVIFNF
jgi:hypothetical protein